MPQMGFFDLSDRYASLGAKKDPLVEINAVVPWDAFRPLLGRVWRKPDEARKSRAGRKPTDVVLMFKTLVLSALYNLSDDQIEYQVRDRLVHHATILEMNAESFRQRTAAASKLAQDQVPPTTTNDNQADGAI